MHVLVTGPLGYIGMVMVPMRLELAHQVASLHSSLHEGCTFAVGGPIGDVPHIQKDVCDADADDLKQIDAVAQLTALSNEPLGKFRTYTYSINPSGQRAIGSARQGGAGCQAVPICLYLQQLGSRGRNQGQRDGRTASRHAFHGSQVRWSATSPGCPGTASAAPACTP